MKFTPGHCLSFVLASHFSFRAQGLDLFSDKSYPSYSKFWNVQYFSTYKIATNLATNTSYLLYQNGTEPPTSEIGRHDAVLQIPLLGNIGIAETPTIPFLELLGVRTRVSAYLGDSAYIASPCFLELISTRVIIGFAGNSSDSTALADAEINATSLVTFATINDDIWAIANKVYISEYLETSNNAIYEWLKFYSVFFNLESDANRLCNETFARALCVEENAASITTDNPNRPVVLWAYYSTYAKGWSLATCPNYYCEFASACFATLVPAANGSITAFGANFLTDDEFLQVGKNADYWIYPSPDWDNIYAANQTMLAQFKSVKNKQVFDYQGSGKHAWFEERFSEYDVVIQDFCSVVGKYLPTPTSHKRVWFRNVFSEAIGNLPECTNTGAPLESRATQCTSTTSSSTSVKKSSGLGIAVWLLLIVTGLSLS